jgi:hypothetical protein
MQDPLSIIFDFPTMPVRCGIVVILGEADATNPSYSLHGRDSLAGMVQTPGIT